MGDSLVGIVVLMDLSRKKMFFWKVSLLRDYTAACKMNEREKQVRVWYMMSVCVNTVGKRSGVQVFELYINREIFLKNEYFQIMLEYE